MTDFINELLSEVPGEGGPPTSSPSTAGRMVEVAAPSVPSVTPSGRAILPASLARRTIGEAKVKRPNLKRLSQRHKLIIGMHLTGKSSMEIAGIVGCSAQTVNKVILDPLAQEVVAYYYEGTEEELKALFPKVVDTVRDALDSGNIETRLKGVDRFTKLTGRDEEKGSKEVNVNVVLDARTKFVNEIRAEAGKVIDVEATSVAVEEVE